MSIALLQRIMGFCDRAGLPESTFGRRAVNDPRLVSDIRKGRALKPRTVARIRRFMEAQT